MNPAESILELVVGVDLGFTCTGVAFCEANKTEPANIHKWPQSPLAATNKVPTRVAYRGGRRGYSWGFGCPLPGSFGQEEIVKEHFKLLLDPKFWYGAFGREPDLAPGDVLDIEDWFRDFLTSLYKHIVSYFTTLVTPEKWEKGRVQYIFSIPTTWQEKSVIQKFEEIVKKAGFGSSKGQTVTIGQSEAEAAAIYTAMFPKEHYVLSYLDGGTRNVSRREITAYEKGDVLLVCDAGGGTTDVCVLEVTSDGGSPIALDQLSHVEGEPIGSVQIDNSFQDLVEKRFLAASQAGSQNPQYQRLRDAFRSAEPRITPRAAAREMARGQKFQANKKSCGTELAEHVEVVSIPVPGLGTDFDFDFEGGEGWVIKGGMMQFRREDIEGLFDTKVKDIIELINKQLGHLEKSAPIKRVSYIVLSGGLGSSMYVQKRISEKYNRNGIQILVSNDPQLAVCKGLVLDRLHHLQSQSSALRIRRCRASYGILVTPSTTPGRRKEKEKEKHRKLDNLFLLGNRRPKSTSAHPPRSLSRNEGERIRWLIEKNEPVSVGGVERCKVSRIVDTDGERVWADKIVFSTLDKDDLPSHILDIPKRNSNAPKSMQTIAMLESNLMNLPPNQTPFPFADFDSSGPASSSSSLHNYCQNGNKDGKGKEKEKNNKHGNRNSDNNKKATHPTKRNYWPFPLAMRPQQQPKQQEIINYEISVSIGPKGLEFRSWVYGYGGGGRAGGDTNGDTNGNGNPSGIPILVDGVRALDIGDKPTSKDKDHQVMVKVGERHIPLSWTVFPDDEEEEDEVEGEEDDEEEDGEEEEYGEEREEEEYGEERERGRERRSREGIR